MKPKSFKECIVEAGELNKKHIEIMEELESLRKHAFIKNSISIKSLIPNSNYLDEDEFTAVTQCFENLLEKRADKVMKELKKYTITFEEDKEVPASWS